MLRTRLYLVAVALLVACGVNPVTGKKELTLVGEDTEASAVVHSAIEDFAQELAYVTRRFLKTRPGKRRLRFSKITA